MPKLVVYTLLDKVAKIASNPSIHCNDDDALRYFETVICREGSIPAQRPADFEWKKIALFDRSTGKVEAV